MVVKKKKISRKKIVKRKSITKKKLQDKSFSPISLKFKPLPNRREQKPIFNNLIISNSGKHKKYISTTSNPFLKSPYRSKKSKPFSLQPTGNSFSPRMSMNWNQAKKKYPRMDPFGDYDLDGSYNAIDCKPFDPSKDGAWGAIKGIFSGGKGAIKRGWDSDDNEQRDLSFKKWERQQSVKRQKEYVKEFKKNTRMEEREERNKRREERNKRREGRSETFNRAGQKFVEGVEGAIDKTKAGAKSLVKAARYATAPAGYVGSLVTPKGRGKQSSIRNTQAKNYNRMSSRERIRQEIKEAREIDEGGRPRGTYKTRINPIDGQQVRVSSKEFNKLKREARQIRRLRVELQKQQTLHKLSKEGVAPTIANRLVEYRENVLRKQLREKERELVNSGMNMNEQNKLNKEDLKNPTMVESSENGIESVAPRSRAEIKAEAQQEFESSLTEKQLKIIKLQKMGFQILPDGRVIKPNVPQQMGHSPSQQYTETRGLVAQGGFQPPQQRKEVSPGAYVWNSVKKVFQSKPKQQSPRFYVNRENVGQGFNQSGGASPQMENMRQEQQQMYENLDDRISQMQQEQENSLTKYRNSSHGMFDENSKPSN